MSKNLCPLFAALAILLFIAFLYTQSWTVGLAFLVSGILASITERKYDY